MTEVLSKKFLYSISTALVITAISSIGGYAVLNYRVARAEVDLSNTVKTAVLYEKEHYFKSEINHINKSLSEIKTSIALMRSENKKRYQKVKY